MNQRLFSGVTIKKYTLLILLCSFPLYLLAQTSRSTNLTGEQKCFSYSNQDAKNACMAALNRGTPVGNQHCLKLSDSDSVNSCLARSNRQPAYCGSIKSPKLKESCYKNLGAGGTNTLSGMPENVQEQGGVTFLNKKYVYADRTRDHVAYINIDDIVRYSTDTSSRYRKYELLTIMDNVNKYALDFGKPRLFGSMLFEQENDCAKDKYRVLKANMFGGRDGSSPFNEKNTSDLEWDDIPLPTQIGVVHLIICGKYDAKASHSQNEPLHIDVRSQQANSSGESSGNTVTCASIKGAEASCDWDFKAHGKPVIKSQQSKTACIEGKTYFLDSSNNSIIVKSGCRAIFGN